MTTYRTTAPTRRGRRKAALALAGATGALMVLAGNAGAATFTPADTDEFAAAIASANSTPGTDRIILAETFYLPTSPINITDNLTITGDHATQSFGGGPAIDGTSIIPLEADAVTVATGVTLRLEGFTYQGGSATGGFAALKVGLGATAILDNMVMSSHGGRALDVLSGGLATLTNTNVTLGGDIGIVHQGTVTLNNSNVTQQLGGGIAKQPGGVLNINNSIVAENGSGTDCYAPANSTINSLDSRGPTSQCGVAIHASPNLEFENINGGPVLSQRPLAGSPVINAGSASVCPTTDMRFYVRPNGACDIGAYEVGPNPVPAGGTGSNDGLRDTTAPTCVVTAVRAGPPKQQDVTLRDGGSGIGNDAVRSEQITIANGTVAFTPFATPFRSPTSAPAPSNNGLVLTATKTDQAQVTQWSFIARDWAGNVRNCA